MQFLQFLLLSFYLFGSIHAQVAVKNSSAEKNNALVIVVVSTADIMKNSLQGQEIQKNVAKEEARLTAPFEKLEQEMKAKEAALIDKQKSLAKEEENFKNQASLLSTDARTDKYDELQEKRRNIEEEIADFQRAMRKAHEDAKKIQQKLELFYRKEMMAFEQEIKILIDQIAHEQGWDIVIPKEMTMSASAQADVTHRVIAKIDEKKIEKDRQERAAQALKSSTTAKKPATTLQK